MADSKMFIGERGDPDEVFRLGRGYTPPAGGGGLPPGWGEPPHMMGEVDPYETAPRYETIAPPPPPDFGPIQPPPEPAPEAPMDTQPNLINLERGTAAFQGYLLELAPETVARMQELLAGEVLRKLEDERKRVLKSIMPIRASTGRTDVPEVSGPSNQVGAAESETKVRRVRKQRANKGAKDVPPVPSQEGGEA